MPPPNKTNKQKQVCQLQHLCAKPPPRSQNSTKSSGRKSCESGDINF